uniref:tyrosine-type recombinase/integrase n=1 Tax=Argonema antarcticum TaxID=2942763 RepID=UPI0020130BEF
HISCFSKSSIFHPQISFLNQFVRNAGIPTHPHLVKLLDAYRPQSGKIYLFPGRHGRGHINPRAAALILKQACERVGLTGVSTHSFRRTALTSLSSTGITLQTLQAISGLESVAALQKYLDKKEVQLSDAIASLKF